ncbi:MAG: hypothetical protein O2798_01510 [Chloroflexi bacterium]|nr:hypothetical protein [Chloroflexota bacterium]MDA1239497.1 hypothetical protein [Chloroflexota bacterium]
MSEEPTEQEGGTPDGPVTAGDLLRQALVDDEDPRFPRWLPLPGVVLTAGWAGFEAVAKEGDFLPTLLWPGAAILFITTLVAWFGWQLEID